MSAFDLIFLAAALGTIGTIVALVALLARKRAVAARRLAVRWVALAAGYLAIALVVDAMRTQLILREEQPWCFDDWCLTVTGTARDERPDGTACTVAMRISSTARRVSQRAAGAWVYLVDARGRRYAPHGVGGAQLDALLEPGEELELQRTFVLPKGAAPVGLITGHGGPYCGPMSWLVIGDGGCLFGKPAMIELGATR